MEETSTPGRALALSIAAEVAAKSGVARKESYKDKPIDYIDPAPKPFIVQISLLEYFERIKKHKADRWQHDFCNKLESACVGRKDKRLWSLIHAEAQLGKSSILAQVFPAWIIGHDPLHRFALATYNATRSQAHSKVVIGILNLELHKQIFPSKDGRVNPNASKERWSTDGRRQLNDAQDSYNPVGLQSGLTGSGFDTLVIDDPYANEKEAFSDAVRLSLQNFWDFTVMSRISQYSNVFGMFHRYHEQDLAGYLLDKGDFDYWRYATECDGPYLHEKTGQLFPDPLNRQIGEYISERRSPNYYTKNKANPRVWNSMFQGKPTSDEGDFFKVDRIEVMDDIMANREWGKCLFITRAWDHAATDGAGDFTAGALIGMQPDGTTIVKDMKLVQKDSAERVAYQKEVAAEDGLSVPICIPQEVGEAGKTLVFAMQQFLKGHTVIPRHVQTNSQTVTMGNNPKQRRAYNFSVAVNAGQVKFFEGSWNSEVIRALKNFGFTTFDDPCDALGDGYNYLFEVAHKGLVIQSEPVFEPWNTFEHGPIIDSVKTAKIPANWTVYVGMKLSADQTFPTSGVVVARAAENSGLKDHLFILGEYKEYTAPFFKVFDWLHEVLTECCERPSTALIHVHPDSEAFLPTIRQKLKQRVILFKESADAGITEINWYLQNKGLTALVADVGQMGTALDRYGLKDLRQEARTWGYNDKGDPNGVGQVWDCLRMIAYRFRTRSTAMTFDEQLDSLIPVEAKEALKTAENGTEKLTAVLNYEFQREIAEQKLRPEEDEWEDFE